MPSSWILWISTYREALGAIEKNPTAALLMIDATPEQSCSTPSGSSPPSSPITASAHQRWSGTLLTRRLSKAGAVVRESGAGGYRRGRPACPERWAYREMPVKSWGPKPARNELGRPPTISKVPQAPGTSGAGFDSVIESSRPLS